MQANRKNSNLNNAVNRKPSRRRSSYRLGSKLKLRFFDELMN
jgi:hypothetical protein